MIFYFQGHCVSINICSHPFFQRYRVNSQFQLQPSIRSMALFLLWRSSNSGRFFQIYCIFAEEEMWLGDIVTNYETSLVLRMYILKEACYLATSFPAVHFFYGSVIISREHLKRSNCQGLCDYFIILVVLAIHFNKRSVVDTRFKGHVYLMKAILALSAVLLIKRCLFHRTINYVWKVLC